jgi:predicted DNA-binding transcriptional regulator AlpA
MTRRLLTVRAAAAHLTLSKSTLDKLRLTGGGPPFMKLGSRRVVYDLDELDAWATQGRRQNTSAPKSGGAR